MVIYFTDRKLNLLGTASTSLPRGLRIVGDNTTEDIETGVNTFSCTIYCNGEERTTLESLAQEGNFILKSGGSAFDNKENTYDSLYQIVELEFDTFNESLTLYAEDAGLDLLNKIVPATTQTSKTLSQMISSVVGSDWTINCLGTPTTTKTYTWDGENTATERIKSIVGLFNCELYYSFEIERFKISKKIINVIPKRGTQVATAQLRLGQEINSIVTKKSIANLATAYEVTGGTLSGSSTPIDLKGYSYTYTDDKGDKYQVDTTTGQMRNITQMARWSGALDADGLIVKRYSFNTTDKATLAGEARAALQKVCYPELNYDCDIIKLPDGVRVGDRVNIVDREGNLYLEARILKLDTSVSDDKQIATLGEYLIKEGGISDIISKMAQDFAEQVKDGINAATISVTSSGGNVFHNIPIATTLSATVFFGDYVITTQVQLEEVFGTGAQIKWYNLNDELVGTGFTYSVSTTASTVEFNCRLIVED